MNQVLQLTQQLLLSIRIYQLRENDWGQASQVHIFAHSSKYNDIIFIKKYGIDKSKIRK